MTPHSNNQTGVEPSRSSLRKKLIDARMAATIAQREAWDRSIIGHLRPYLLELGLRKIGAYWPIRNEPDLRGLLKELDRAGFEIGLPQVIAADAPLQFLRWHADSPMRMDAHKIAIPDAAEPMTPELLLLPCVGFFSTGQRHFRQGYGGGYYDRTLAAHPAATIGVAYQCSRITSEDGFVPEPHDAALTRIVTEAGWA